VKSSETGQQVCSCPNGFEDRCPDGFPAVANFAGYGAAMRLSPDDKHPQIVVASHGNLIALALHAIVPDQVGFEFWAAMPTPAVYLLPGDGTVSGPGLGD